MTDIKDQRALVVGCTGGVGRSITGCLVKEGARVLGVAQHSGRLDELQREFPGIDVRTVDASDLQSAERLITENDPDILVVALGATPHMAPVSEHTWETFARNWEIDVKSTFGLCKAALSKPLKPGAIVILISGGPALGASPLSGGLSPAKNGQLFLADACQWQSRREELNIRFVAIAPKRVMPNTTMGKVASNGYAEYLGISVEAFMAG